MLVMFAADLHVNTTAWIRFLSLHFAYCYNTLQSYPDSSGYNKSTKRCSNFTDLSPSDNNLFSFEIVAKCLALELRYQLLSVITSYHAETPTWRLWQAERGIPGRRRWCSSWKGKWQWAPLSSCSFSPRIISHLSAVEQKWGRKKDPHMWVLKACGFITWSASITVNLLNLTIWNIITHATYSLPTGHNTSLPRNSPVTEHSGYISFIMWSIGRGYAKCRNRHTKSFFGHIFWKI